MVIYANSGRASESLVVLHDLLAAIKNTVHAVRVDDGVGLIVIENDGREAGAPLCGLLLQLLATSRIIHHGDLSRIVDVELAVVDETLNLKAHMFSVTEISLKVLISFLKLLDLS